MNLQLVNPSAVPVITETPADTGVAFTDSSGIDYNLYLSGWDDSEWTYQEVPQSPQISEPVSYDAPLEEGGKSENSKFYYYAQDIGGKKIYSLFDKATGEFIGTLEVNIADSQGVDIALQYQSKSGLPVDTDLVSSQIMPKSSTWLDGEGNVVNVNSQGTVSENGAVKILKISEPLSASEEDFLENLVNSLNENPQSVDEFQQQIERLSEENRLTEGEIQKIINDFVNEEGKYAPGGIKFAKKVMDVVDKLFSVEDVQASVQEYEADMDNLNALRKTWKSDSPLKPIDVDLRKTMGPPVVYIYENGMGGNDFKTTYLDPVINEMTKSGFEVKVITSTDIEQIKSTIGNADIAIFLAHGTQSSLKYEQPGFFAKYNPFAEPEWFDAGFVKTLEKTPKFVILSGCDSFQKGKYGNIVEALGEKGTTSVLGVNGFAHVTHLKGAVTDSLEKINSQFVETGVINPEGVKAITNVPTYGVSNRFTPDTKIGSSMILAIPKNVKK